MIERFTYPLDRYGNDAGPTTPWGKAQGSYKLARGVIFYYTSGHGGMKVSKRIADKYMTEYARTHCIDRYGAYWFEEDCDINLPLYELSLNMPGFAAVAVEFSKNATIEKLPEYIRRWNSDYPFAAKEA